MEKIAKYYLKDNKELLKEYEKAEKKYIKRLGKKYETITIDLELDDKYIKDIFIALANSKMCLDDLLVCALKTKIFQMEMDKL